MAQRSQLRGTGFFRLWTSESVSLIGTQLTMFALPLVAVMTLHAQAWEMGLLTAAGSLAVLFFGLSAGVWADQYERRGVMLLVNAVRAVTLLFVPVLYWLDLLTMAVLLIVAFIVGAMSLLFDSAMSSYMPRLVGKPALGPANSWMQGTEAVGEIGGPGLAGLLVQFIGAPVTLLIDSLSYLVSSLSLLSLPKAPPKRSDEHKNMGHVRAAREGIVLVWRNNILRPLALSAAHFNFFTAMFFAIYVLYVVRVLQFSPLLLGLSTMLGGLGGLVSAPLVGRIGRTFGVGRMLIVCYAAPGLAGLLVPAAASVGLTAAVVLVGASSFLWSFCVVILLVSGMTIKQSLVGDGYLGRTTATFRFLTWGVEPFGAVIGGVLGSTLGLRTTLVFASLGLLLSALWTYFSDIRQFRGIDAADEAHNGAPGPEPDLAAVAKGAAARPEVHEAKEPS